MTHEEFQKKVNAIPGQDLIEKAQKALSKLCSTGGQSFTMTVPPQLDDTDIIFSEIIERFASLLNKQLEDYMIEGLKRKGFEFKNRTEFENFIKSNCRCEDRTDIKQRTYFVNDIPFFLHCYEMEMDLNQIQTDMELKVSANYGRYAYL